MSESLYELLALVARYIFAGLMILIVARAWRITLVDSRRAKTLRRLSPQTGIIGEMMVMEGEDKARRGMKYKVIREGQIGSSRRADIRIRHGSVRRRHAYFLFTEEGLHVRAHAGAPLRGDDGEPVREILLRDGDTFDVGRVQLMLILSQAPESDRAPERRRRRGDDEYDRDEYLSDMDTLFDPDDDLFVPDDNLFAPDDGLFNADFREPSYTPASRRRLPLTLEEGPGLRSSAYGDLRRRRHSSSLREDRTEPSLRRSSAKANRNFHIEDNPLNRRRPQNGSANPAGYPAEDSSDDREMW